MEFVERIEEPHAGTRKSAICNFRRRTSSRALKIARSSRRVLPLIDLEVTRRKTARWKRNDFSTNNLFIRLSFAICADIADCSEYFKKKREAINYSAEKIVSGLFPLARVETPPAVSRSPTSGPLTGRIFIWRPVSRLHILAHIYLYLILLGSHCQPLVRLIARSLSLSLPPRAIITISPSPSCLARVPRVGQARWNVNYSVRNWVW